MTCFGCYTMNMKMIKRMLILVTGLMLQSCATVEGPPNPDDPYESFNRSMFAFNEGLDKYALKPLAEGYKAVTPAPVDTGITNFFSNLDDIIVIINDLLQLKFEQALRDTSRFIWNTTFGLAGFIDVATGFGLPKNSEDFGQTLGYWGVGHGPYLVLPVLGASGARDAVGFAVDASEFDPVFDEIDGDARYAVIGLKYVDIRADLLSATNVIDQTAPDKYAFIRDAWMQRRLSLVHDGNPPEQYNEEDLFEEEDLFTDDIKR